MIAMLMQHIISILTGRKLYLIVSLMIIFSGCRFFAWDVLDDNIYSIHIKNTTKDTLLIDLDGSNGKFNYENIMDFAVYPDSSHMCCGKGGVGGDEGFDPITESFSGVNLDFCRVYKFSSDIIKEAIQQGDTSNGYITISQKYLKIVWEAPLRKMGDSINSYFNYDSWDYWFVDEQNRMGIMQFTIYENDFIENE